MLEAGSKDGRREKVLAGRKEDRLEQAGSRDEGGVNSQL
jgi:hypothetical protein